MVNSIGNLAPNFINVPAWAVTQAPAFRKYHIIHLVCCYNRLIMALNLVGTGKIVTTSTTALMIIVCFAVYFLEEKKILLPKPVKRIETDSTIDKE